MAITINQRPSSVAPAYNDLIWLVTSNNSASANFKFLCQVENTTNTEIARLEVPIFYGTTNRGRFDVSRIVESYLGSRFGDSLRYDFTYELAEIGQCLNSYFEYVVRFGEEYGSPASAFTALTSASGNYIWNAALDFLEVPSFNINQWQVSGTNGKFLTTIRSKRIYENQYDWLYFLHQNGGANGVDSAEVIAYSNTGSQLASSVIRNDFNIADNAGKMLRMPAGYNLNLIPSGELTSGTAGNIIPSGTSYYTIQLKNGANNRGEQYRYDIRTDCSKYPAIEVYFLNKWGAMECVMFNFKSEKNYGQTKQTFKKQPYALDNTIPQIGYDAQARGRTNFVAKERQRLTLNTGLINDNESEWLKELVSSPVVFINLDSTICAVNIISDNYNERQTVNDHVFNLTIEVELTFDNRRQRL